jgi:hypothetical protein
VADGEVAADAFVAPVDPAAAVLGW